MNTERRGFPPVLIIVVIALIALGAWYFSSSKNNEVVLDETWTHEYRPYPEFNPQWPNQYHNGLVISPQKATDVTADQAYLESPGFIVVHRVVQDSPGEVLGVSAYLDKGLHTNVPLNASLEPESTYFAFLYADDGDKMFNLEKDTILLFYDGPNKMYLENRVAQFETL